ncbi:MAG: translation elongation factor Ts [Chloroflexota bacterium]
MAISTDMIKDLREKSGAGIMDCRNALVSAEGDTEKAIQILKEKGFLKAEKKAERVTAQGVVEAYIHLGGRIGAMVELNCESDFVARTDEFKTLAHCLAMQVAALAPQCISQEELPEGAEVEPEVACLLLQPYIKDPAITIKELIMGAIAKVGENIRVKRFARFELGN